MQDNPLEQEKATLEKINGKLSEIMEILRTEPTTPFCDTIVMLNMLSCNKSIAGVISSKLAAIAKSPKVLESLAISDSLEKNCMKASHVHNESQNLYVDAAALSDTMMKLASYLLDGEFFVVKDTGKKDESDTHRIYTFD